MDPVSSLEAALAQHLEAIQRAAYGAPPGGGPEWDAMLRHYRVSALDPQERAMIVSCMHMQRGAVPAEVRVVLAGLQAWLQQALEPLRASGSPLFSALQQRAASLVDTEIAGYERAVGIAASQPMAPAPRTVVRATIVSPAIFVLAASSTTWAG